MDFLYKIEKYYQAKEYEIMYDNVELLLKTIKKL